MSCCCILFPRGGSPKGGRYCGDTRQLPDEASACHETGRKCVPLVRALCGADFKDFPELTPFLGHGVKEMCSLDQMDESHKTILGVI